MATGIQTVLIVDYFFPPMAGSGVQRTLGYVRHLQEYGWSPIVLTVRSGDHFMFDPSLLQGIPDNVVVLRTPSIEPVRFGKQVINMLSRTSGGLDTGNLGDGRPMWKAGWVTRLERWMLFPDRRIGWFPFAVARALALHRRRNIDVIYSTSTSVTSHLIAHALKMFLGIPWVADFQDPWAEELAGPVRRNVGRRLERLILRNADRVTFTTGPLLTMFRQHHPMIPAHKLVAIPMGFHPDAFVGVEPEHRRKFTITHFGAFYAPRSPRPFLEALARCVSGNPAMARDIEVLFFGLFDVEMLRVTEALIRQRNLQDIVRLPGVVSYKVGVKHLMSSNVLLLVTAPGTHGQVLVPSKLYEYLAAGRPILALTPEGPAAQIVREAHAGSVVDVGDVEGIANAISALYGRWCDGTLGFLVNREVAKRFAWGELTRQFASILDDSIAARRHA